MSDSSLSLCSFSFQEMNQSKSSSERSVGCCELVNKMVQGLFSDLETSHSSSVSNLSCPLARWPRACSLPGAVPDHHRSQHVG